MWRLWLVMGSAVWLATISASAAVNYLAGFELGRTAAEAYVFAVLGVCADAWKAIGPIFIVTLLRGRKLMSAGLAGAVWLLCFAVAVSAALGLAAQNRSARSGGQETLRLSYEDAQKALAEFESKRAAIGVVGSRADYEGTISVLLAQAIIGGTVASLSRNCEKDHPRARAACAEIAGQRRELARVVGAETLDDRIASARRDVARLRERGGTRDLDPQAQLISRLSFGRIAAPDVGMMLTLLLVAMVELISAFAPVVLHEYVGTVRGRTRKVAARRVRPRQAVPGPGRTEPLKRVGDLYEYLAERVVPEEEGSLSAGILFTDYHAWCTERGCAALQLGRFTEALDEIARRDLKGRIRRKGSVYWGLRLARQQALPAPPNAIAG